MNEMIQKAERAYPEYCDHQAAWEDLAARIAAFKPEVREVPDGEILPNSNPGTLSIIGSGIETLGFSMSDQTLLENADKVLFCVADPATIVWLKRLRPDALDLYVLYGDDKIRYTTYMQMAEAQLYWVRQGLNVVVVFYGHPGIFVLSTHRAIMIARREGHRAVMKAGVSALDTLCSDLGVDPSHPGLQTFEATDALTRRRHIDRTLHVVLWQVGLIGELGYRRHGYLNNNFSYFVRWLEEIYGSDFEITHYIGSRYPTIDPLVVQYRLSELHDPEVQETITGLSTFYLPPQDVVPTDRQTAMDLGLIEKGQTLSTPKSPLREIGKYGSREMVAFDAFRRFRIPPSYRWQEDTGASDFLIALRFDPKLQANYAADPLAALEQPRFAGLSDKERAMLASRDSGAIQIAAKGGGRRSITNETLFTRLLTSKSLCRELIREVKSKPRSAAREAFGSWAEREGFELDWAHLHSSLDFVSRAHLFPWTGVYGGDGERPLVTIIGNRASPRRSVVYVDDVRVRRFDYRGGSLRWQADSGVPFHGVLKVDQDSQGRRRLVGKIRAPETPHEEASTLYLSSVDPARAELAAASAARESKEPPQGRYALRQSGRYARQVHWMEVSADGVTLNGESVGASSWEAGTLRWVGGPVACAEGELSFVMDPVVGSCEAFGTAVSGEGEGRLSCYGARLLDGELKYGGPSLADDKADILARIAADSLDKGGLMLWHKWEKAELTYRFVCFSLASIL